MTPVKLQLAQISKTFEHDRQHTDVLNRVSINVDSGEFVSIIGPSGSGKTTLFHIIGGLIEPTEGNVFLDGENITGRKGLVSYMPQQSALLPWRTIEHNVILAQEVAGLPKRTALEQAGLWLERVGLQGYEKQYPHVLSGGMQQRVSFLRALLSPHEMMCLDEPFGALDALTRQEMQTWLLNIWEQNRRSVLFITHSIEEALLLSDRIYVLSDKPASVIHELNVPFERPRQEGIFNHPHFLDLRSQLQNLLRNKHYMIEYKNDKTHGGQRIFHFDNA